MTSAAWLRQFYRRPWVGLSALVVVFLALPLTHSITVLVNRTVGREDSLLVLFPIGLIALIALVVGIRRNREVSGTLVGFLTGYLLWTGWASYAFRFNEISLNMPMAVLEEGSRRPVHLLFIQGSFGICVVTLLYFVFDRNTRCSAFMWIQRVLRLGFGKADSAQQRNYCRVTFIETVYVIWFCYALSLFLGDPRFLGYDHPVTYGVLAVLLGWGSYLLWRLLKFSRLMAAIRYAIPTKALFWIPVGEFFPRYGFYEEFWLRPWAYKGPMLAVLGVFLLLLIASPLLPQRKATGDGA